MATAFPSNTWLVMVPKSGGQTVPVVDPANPMALEKMTTLVSAAQKPTVAEISDALAAYAFSGQQLVVVPLGNATIIEAQSAVHTDWTITIVS